MRRVLSLLLIIILYTGASMAQQNRENVYVKAWKTLNDTLTSHFQMGKGTTHFYGSVQEYKVRWSENIPEEFGYNLFINQENEPRVVYDTILNFAARNAIHVYDVNDTCLFVLLPYKLWEDETTVDEKVDKARTIMQGNIKRGNQYPIPGIGFQVPFWNTTYNGWDKNMKLYVLSAKPGKYLDDIYLYKGNKWLPKEWQHGYSRGIAINEKSKEIYYWLVIW